MLFSIIKSRNRKQRIFIYSRDYWVNGKWDGRKLSIEEAKEISWIDNVVYLDKFENYLFGFLNSMRYSKSSKTVLFDLERRNDPNYHSLALDFLADFSKNIQKLK